MNMFEEARTVYGMLRILGGTQEEAAQRLGVSQSYIANKLRLLKFSQPIQDLIVESLLSERHARALLRLSDEGVLRSVILRIRDEHLSVAETEAVVDLLSAGREGDRKEQLHSFSRMLNTALLALQSGGIQAVKTTEEEGDDITITLRLTPAKAR